MQTQTISDVSTDVIMYLVKSWLTQSAAISTFFEKYSDEEYFREIAPGRNRAIYILGHLTASNDSMLPLLGFGGKLFPELESFFITNPDKALKDLPTIPELKQKWQIVNTTLRERFSTMEPHDWLDRHTLVNQEDFFLDPHRNKLNILLTRTNHISYHLGQLNLLKK